MPSSSGNIGPCRERGGTIERPAKEIHVGILTELTERRFTAVPFKEVTIQLM
jgi:hypothetical protein